MLPQYVWYVPNLDAAIHLPSAMRVRHKSNLARELTPQVAISGDIG